MASDKLPQSQIAWRMGEWRDAVRISRETWDKLPPKQRPKTVIVGKTARVIEAPLDWLLRIDGRNGKHRGR